MAFYAYVHAKPNGAPFYVGKGKGRRAYLFKGRNPHHQAIVRKYGEAAIQVKIIPAASESEAIRMEVALIRMLREAGHHLVNQTDGGDGLAGHTRSEETRARISATNRATMSDPAFKSARSAMNREIHNRESVREAKAEAQGRFWSDPEHSRLRRERMSGYRWVTNGEREVRLWKGQRLPEGFFFGRSFQL